MKYRMRPLPVEATQYEHGVAHSGVNMVSDPQRNLIERVPTVPTERGELTVQPGDWVVVFPGGVKTVVSAEHFSQLYEEAGEDSSVDGDSAETTPDSPDVALVAPVAEIDPQGSVILPTVLLDPEATPEQRARVAEQVGEPASPPAEVEHLLSA